MGIGIVHHSVHHSSPANIAHAYISMRYTSFDGKNGAGGELVPHVSTIPTLYLKLYLESHL